MTYRGYVGAVRAKICEINRIHFSKLNPLRFYIINGRKYEFIQNKWSQ